MIDQFKQAPKGAQTAAAALAGGGLLGAGYLIHSLVIVVVFVAVIVVAILLWIGLQRWKARKRARLLRGQLSLHSASAPNAISDPARRAKLDDLRRSFAKGIEKFTAAGKDLYSLPWYVICGEPGSGKTEAVRHCNVGFPPGLQDEMQGAGGTINMHWWFTNHAVLIDTAGKLLFQEAPPGTTSEWLEFLALLRKARPNCPINGLMLVIPSESLVRDSFEEIQRKAGKIAHQLDTIQRTLDVRFPVFVLITKCDLINGFREFFSGIKDPRLQQQMTGWSNPAPLDTPFAPEAVDDYLAEVVQQTSRRRLGLMRDPVSADPGKRRMDDVDALFALPASLSALGPRLRKYLETIFVAGEWSAKPLFLRGIYFTSALTEGSALDAELATALGLPVEQLPEGKAWERERSFFLRDLFIQKIFKEKGLVTRASNTSTLLKRRRQLVGAVFVAGLAAVLVVSYLGSKTLKSSVSGELVYWRPAARSDNWFGAHWFPVVNSDLQFTGGDTIKLDDGREWPIVEYQEKLQQLVSTPLHIPWVFKPVASVALRASANRREAQRVLFDASVISPIVDANRDRLINATTWSAADSDRLGALAEIEGAIYLKGLPGFDPDYPADDFFPPLLGPSLAKVPDGAAIDNRLMRVFDWTYRRGGAGRGMWPESWLSAGMTLRDNQPLLRGWETLERSMQTAEAAQREAVQTVRTGRLTVIRFRDAEKAFLAAVDEPRSLAGWKDGVVSAWGDLNARRTDVDTLVDALRHAAPGAAAPTLDASYRAIVDRIRSETNQASRRLRAVLARQKAATAAAANAVSGPASEFTLYSDLSRRLAALDAQVTGQFRQDLPLSEQAELAPLDADTLQPMAGGSAAYARRADLYAQVVAVLAPSASGPSMFGHLPDLLARESAALASAREIALKYDGPLRQDFTGGAQRLIDAATTLGPAALGDAYGRAFDLAFPATAGYPLGSGPSLTADQLKAAIAMLGAIRSDGAAPAVAQGLNSALGSRFDRASRLAAFAPLLLGSGGNPGQVTLRILRDSDQAPVIEQVTGASFDPRQALGRVFPTLQLGGRSFRDRGLEDNLEVGRFSIAAPLPRLEFFITADVKPEPDAQIAPTDPWGALRLIQQGAVRHEDGKAWDAVVHLTYLGRPYFLAVSLTLEQPLPRRDDWPAALR
ncbi:MAG: type VI secretion protein IcmF/TssM N-terminal domain-containing protein [Opitutaceae bacterium]